MPNYQYVIDSSFKPYSFQEMLVPFALYKDAWEKNEENYDNLMDKLGRYSNLPNGTAKDIYDKYYNDLHNYGKDFSHHGLSIDNQAGLMDMKRRYSGEIGRLDRANEALQEELKLRRTADVQDPSRLYSTYNLNLDQFLDNNRPDLYSISGDSLYKLGVETGAAESATHYTALKKVKAITDYYDEIGRTVGYSPELRAKFRQDINAIPELRDSVNSILKQTGAADHLTGAAYERAKDAVVNGILNGATYKIDSQLQQNLGVLTAEQQKSYDLNNRQLAYQAANSGLKEVKPGVFRWDKDVDPDYQKAMEIQKLKNNNKNGNNTLIPQLIA